MKNASYGEFMVNVFHKGQNRKAILHVVIIGKENKFFLFDLDGWAIDDCANVHSARDQYKLGTAKKL